MRVFGFLRGVGEVSWEVIWKEEGLSGAQWKGSSV